MIERQQAVLISPQRHRKLFLSFTFVLIPDVISFNLFCWLVTPFHTMLLPLVGCCPSNMTTFSYGCWSFSPSLFISTFKVSSPCCPASLQQYFCPIWPGGSTFKKSWLSKRFLSHLKANPIADIAVPLPPTFTYLIKPVLLRLFLLTGRMEETTVWAPMPYYTASGTQPLDSRSGWAGAVSYHYHSLHSSSSAGSGASLNKAPSRCCVSAHMDLGNFMGLYQIKKHSNSESQKIKISSFILSEWVAHYLLAEWIQ